MKIFLMDVYLFFPVFLFLILQYEHFLVKYIIGIHVLYIHEDILKLGIMFYKTFLCYIKEMLQIC